MRERVRQSFVTDLAGFRHLRIRQPGGFVTRATGTRSPATEQKAAAGKQGALAVLSAHLYAFTFVPADNPNARPNAMTQWLRHYIRAIGVRPAHIGMAILTGRLIQTLEPTGALNLTLAALHSHGVSRGQVNIIRGANYSYLLRLQVVNEHISKVVQSDLCGCR